MATRATEGDNVEMNSKDEKYLEEEFKRDREKADESQEVNLLVRGALLRCSCCTHPRRLNLPLSYGVYVKDPRHGKMHERNNIVGDPNNIAYYGVCQSSTPPDSPTVCLEPYVTPQGEKTSTGKIDGKMCTPVIVGKWIDPKDDEDIFDQDDNTTYKAITSNSFLVCQFGGLIEPLTSGQEFEDE